MRNIIFGPANINENGSFYVEGLGQEYVWDVNDPSFVGDGMLWKTSLQDDSVWQTWQQQMVCFGKQTSNRWHVMKTGFGTDGMLWTTGFVTDGMLWKTMIDINKLG